MKRKKILLLSDDIRMHSGVATQAKEIVIGTLDKYDWVQIGGAIKHPDAGKRIVVQSDKSYKLPRENCIIIYPTDGYGNQHMLREIIQSEKPDAILHFTDPRFWVWLYNMEHEIRTNIPILYYNIWDDIPDPMYNRNFYRCSDQLLGISKQTYGINKRVLKNDNYKNWQIQYIPHGVSERKFNKVDKSSSKFIEFESKYGLDKYKYKILYLNRNIRRKSPGDVALAYKHFMDGLTEEQRKECVFIWHSAIIDDQGTDMKAVHKALLPEYPVIFTHDAGGGPLDDEQMNFLYNSCDVYINMASNEGFGLGSLEALSTETPIIVNVTGGLQDQCGFKNDKGEYLTAEDYVELKSNHRGTYKEHGEWVKPVFPSNISLAGSPQTPYIFDDRCSSEDGGEALRYWYDKGSEERERCGQLGCEFVKNTAGMSASKMAKNFEKAFSDVWENWKPKEKYTLEVI
jgi:glycosyltransferase involved in cell wall biosynthesis